MHYETLDVYEQHFLKTLGVTQIPNPTYVTAITIAFQATLQAAIAYHGTVLNNPYLISTSVNIFPQRFIVVIANIPPTIDVLAFVNPLGYSFEFLNWNFQLKVLKKF